MEKSCGVLAASVAAHYRWPLQLLILHFAFC